ncbi:family 78 glycoside hydrolase catalytic domain [Dysgonomonas macrotermitis]|uniref:alpha-L-rhamnosidase n=1 Tax=Dysgonomonas macrotermitis TaxID=1346286 RepID=A0A1M4VP12_9BACT|nr:family 78 glycoside hydrolase catalytic domain [Dysgonomonas macrotermitis]SHE70615.1 alpha-L-rhamnosidase [Dysgonomonas macrotermitis]
MKKQITLICISWIISFFSLVPIHAKTQIGNTAIINMTVDARETPTAIDQSRPDFAWQIQSNTIGFKQVDYQLIVSTDLHFKNIIWDSGIIKSDKSVSIFYGSTNGAKELMPETDYYWKVNITDNVGKKHSATSRFSTGLMNPSMSAWSGAKWIGSNDLNLDATSSVIFNLQTKFQIIKGNKVSVIFGANDFRLNDEFQNVMNVSGENYIKWELDIAGVGKEQGAVINIYRVGYAKGDDPNKPYQIISLATQPKTNINQLITIDNARKENLLEIKVETSEIRMFINGQPVILSDNSTQTMITPLGRAGNNYNTFPNLNSIGFSASKGEKVEFTDYKLMNIGQGRDAALFDSHIGATYSIFKNIPGITVKNNKITVEDKVFGYADPSYYGSLSMLRSEFDLETKAIKKAKVYISALGAYEMYINGKRIGNDWFNPGMSQYRETLTYHAYDVTEYINKGKNAIGAILGPGFYTGYMSYTPSNYNFWGDTEALLAKLVITYEDGSEKIITTNTEDWKLYKGGPIEYASMFQGQRYNANKDAIVSGWNKTGYLSNEWVKPEIITPREWIHFDLIARRDNPIKEVEKLDAVRVLKTHSKSKNTYTYDMSIAMVGVPSITIPAGSLKEGDIVLLRFGEEIYPGNEDSPNGVMPDGVTYESLYGPNGNYRPNVAGRVLHDTYRAALATDFYIASKADETKDVVIEPHFTYRGYRYIQITIPNRTTPLALNNVKGIVLSSEPVKGKYEGYTTDETGKLVNQLYKNIQRSQLGNFFSIPTDCPQRNERMGWTGDAQAYSRTASYNGNIQSFFRQWMIALRNDQGVGGENGAPAGGIGSTVPTFSHERSKSFDDGTTWAAAVCMVPWQLYIQYGDLQVVKENFPTMKLWLDGMNYYKIPGYNGLSSRTSGFADWLSVDVRTSEDICNNAIYLYMLHITAVMADAIGESSYADILRKRFNEGKKAFNMAYVDSETGMTHSISIKDGSIGDIIDSQTSYATPLNFDLFSDDMKIKSGVNAGLSYKEFAIKRLVELAAKPANSGDGGKVLVPFFGGFPGSAGSDVPFNPTISSLDYTITTGFSGTPNILPALARTGQIETAYKMFAATDYASWLYPVKLGSTSMWERWNSYELAFQMNGESAMNSFNHFALGSVGSWIYEYHLGITTESGNGYQNFILQPLPGGTYKEASGTYESNYGNIYSHWTADNGRLLSYEFTVPANTTATLYLPTEESSVGKSSEVEGINYIGMDIRNGIQTAKFEVKAGNYLMKIDGEKWKSSIK